MIDIQALEEFGWIGVDNIDDDNSLKRLARSLGDVELIGKVEHLSPKAEQAASRSFSQKYGFGRFPMHSDTAFWPRPARYVVLRSNKVSTTNTLLLALPGLRRLVENSIGMAAIFSIRTTVGSYYGRALSADDGFRVRFDPCYMKPANSAANILAESLSFPQAEQVEGFPWSGRNALVIDNWRCLHGRAAVSDADSDRTISRIYVGGRA